MLYEVITINSINLVFDSDLNFYYDNMEIYYNFNAFPEVVRDYSVYAAIDNKRVLIANIKDNYQRVNHLCVDSVTTNDRITSYNVCYTKLLRNDVNHQS